MVFEAVIGLEIHVELKTRSKMFSSAPNVFSTIPNSSAVAFDLAHPGAMPTVNKAAVVHGLRVVNALHMEIDPLLRFDRKNYFYPDLPKGYQITQQFHPLGKGGYLDIGDGCRIHLQRAHLEEDTCKQIHGPTGTLLDYNRAGVPLLEIVTLPEIHSGEQACRFVENLRNIVIYAGASDGKMEEGSLRVDVNVSLREGGSSQLGTKVEIKNLNSTKNMQRSIDEEIRRQSEILSKGGRVTQQTFRFDEATGTNVWMRDKEGEVDYKYFPEDNIAPIRLSDSFIEQALSTCPELYEPKKKRYLESGLAAQDAETILFDPSMAAYFDEAIPAAKNPKALASFFNVEVRGYLSKTDASIANFPILPKTLAEVVNLQEDGFTHQQVTSLFRFLLEQPDRTLDAAMEELRLTRTSSEYAYIVPFVNEVLDGNPQSVANFKAGKQRVFGFLVGQVLKATQGKANPSVVAKILEEELKKR